MKQVLSVKGKFKSEIEDRGKWGILSCGVGIANGAKLFSYLAVDTGAGGQSMIFLRKET